jgi:hypothetical protein
MSGRGHAAGVLNRCLTCVRNVGRSGRSITVIHIVGLTLPIVKFACHPCPNRNFVLGSGVFL